MTEHRGRVGRYRRLRGIDQMYLALESTATPMHFGALVVLERRTAVRSRRAAAVGRDPPTARRAGRIDAGASPGHPSTGVPGRRAALDRGPDFRIERHVGAIAMPPPPDDAAMLPFIERLMAALLDRSHPLWRVWFVTGLPDERVAVLFIVHHALTDGLGAMRLGRTLLDGATSTAALPMTPRPPLRTTPLPWRALVRDNAHAILDAAGQLTKPSTWRSVLVSVRLFRVGMAATRGEPDTGLNATVGPRRRLAVLRLDAGMVKRVARAHGGGANDVVLDLAAGGLRVLFASRGRSVGRVAPRAGIAVALPASGPGGDPGNHFGSYVVSLPVRVADPSARLRLVAEERARAKRTQAVTGVTGVRVWATRFAPTRWLMSHQRFINVMETYLPGPPVPIELLGAPVLDLVPIQPLGRNVGLTFIASSYAGRLTITVRADADLFPDLDVLMGAMDREWQALAARVPVRVRSVRSPAAPSGS